MLSGPERAALIWTHIDIFDVMNDVVARSADLDLFAFDLGVKVPGDSGTRGRVH